MGVGGGGMGGKSKNCRITIVRTIKADGKTLAKRICKLIQILDLLATCASFDQKLALTVAITYINFEQDKIYGTQAVCASQCNM